MPRLIPRHELDEMVRLFEAGQRPDVLAAAFGISERAVHLRLAKRGLHYHRDRRPPTREQRLAIEMRRGQINLLRGRDLTVAQMAAHLGVQPRTLRAWMRRHMAELHDQMKAEQRARRAVRPGPRPVERRRPLAATSPVPLTKWRRSRIKSAYLSGDSVAAIARRYGHDATTIWRLLRRQGVRLRSRTARSRSTSGVSMTPTVR